MLRTIRRACEALAEERGMREAGHGPKGALVFVCGNLRTVDDIVRTEKEVNGWKSRGLLVKTHAQRLRSLWRTAESLC